MNKSDIKELVDEKLIPLAEKEIKEKGIFHLYIYKDKEKFTCIENQDEFTRSNWNNLNNMLIAKLRKKYAYSWDRGNCEDDTIQIYFTNHYDKEVFEELKEEVLVNGFVWYYDDREIDTLDMVRETNYPSKQALLIKSIKNRVEDKYNDEFVYANEIEDIYLNLIDYINDTNEEAEEICKLMLDEEDETFCGSQWEDLIFNEYDTPLTIVNQFIDTFLATDFQKYDDNLDDGHPIAADMKTKKLALIKFLENRREYIRNN